MAAKMFFYVLLFRYVFDVSAKKKVSFYETCPSIMAARLGRRREE
jgi:hypothetical protein